MIKVEILTPYYLYTIDYPEAKTLKDAYDHALTIVETKDIFEGPNGIIDIRSTEDIKHIRAYSDNQGAVAFFEKPPILPDSEKEDTSEEDPHFVTHGEFNGQTMKLEGVRKISENNMPYVMVYRINDVDALAQLREDNLVKVADQYARSWAPGYANYAVVIPHAEGLPDENEALEYLLDYIDEVEKPAADGDLASMTAKAYVDWNKEE